MQIDDVAATWTDSLTSSPACTAGQTVEACVSDSRSRLGDARVQAYLPLLSYRSARDR